MNFDEFSVNHDNFNNGLLATLDSSQNYFTLGFIARLVMICDDGGVAWNTSKMNTPISQDTTSVNWMDSFGQTIGGDDNYAPGLLGKNLAMYVEQTNKFYQVEIEKWGYGINEDVRGCGLDEEVIREYNNNLKTCNRKRHRINKIVSGEKNDKILNKIYQYQTRERDKEREKNNFYRWSATALVRSNNSTKFKEIKEFTKPFEHKFFSDKYKTEFIEFSLEELLKHLKKVKVKNVLIVDLTCNDIDIDLLETIGITNEFVTEQKTKKNNTLKSCNCKEYSFFGGSNRRTRKNKNTKKRYSIKKVEK